MGKENCIEDRGQEVSRSLGKMLQGSIRYTVVAGALPTLRPLMTS